MGQHFDHIPARIIPFIKRQKMFWVATAPLAEDGHVNVSPKGCFENTMNIIFDGEDPGEKNSRAIWYEDLSGSGVETIAHLRENGRITVMFTAFDGAPNIVRLYGTGKVFELGTSEYNELLPVEKRQPGSRAVIWVDVHKVGTSCGFSIPFYEYKAPRTKLHKIAMQVEKEDSDCAAELKSNTPSDRDTVDTDSGRLATKGMRNFWRGYNLRSLDGLPGLETAYEQENLVGKHVQSGEVFDAMSQKEPDGDELGMPNTGKKGEGAPFGDVFFTLGVGFLVGTVFMRFTR